MSRYDRLRSQNGGADEDLARLIDEFAERLSQGELLHWPTCLREHPRHAEALRQLAPAIEALAKYGGHQRSSRDDRPSEDRR